MVYYYNRERWHYVFEELAVAINIVIDRWRSFSRNSIFTSLDLFHATAAVCNSMVAMMSLLFICTEQLRSLPGTMRTVAPLSILLVKAIPLLKKWVTDIGQPVWGSFESFTLGAMTIQPIQLGSNSKNERRYQRCTKQPLQHLLWTSKIWGVHSHPRRPALFTTALPPLATAETYNDSAGTTFRVASKGKPDKAWRRNHTNFREKKKIQTVLPYSVIST